MVLILVVTDNVKTTLWPDFLDFTEFANKEAGRSGDFYSEHKVIL